ncbi:phage tail protein [Dokdonella sp.]|uniref:phage tail protein n=1 Tax=Dokdonella sp. TaxID=2291710 RepID=UPI002F3F9A22
MSAPFLGEIRMFGCNFAPRGWMFCNGQLLPIQQYTAVFALLGTYYGGNGTTNFALPDLRGRAPMAYGDGPGLTPRVIGETSGVENVSLLSTEMPVHTHAMGAQATRADRANATGASFAQSATPIYSTGAPSAALSPVSVSLAGGGQPHNNMQPFLAVNFCIAVNGIFPSRS